MNGFIRKAALLLGCAVGVAGMGCATTSQCGSCTSNGNCGSSGNCGGLGRGHLGGAESGATLPCCSNRDLYDRCYPERYSNLAQREVNLAFTPQVQNGHVLDQTVWNHHFEKGTDKLTPGGLAQLQYLARRRPHADTTVYLATALDLDYDPCCPERYCGARQELDALRIASIQKYLVGLNCGRALDFQVLVHDPADVTLTAGTVPGLNPVTNALGQRNAGFRGILGGGGVAGPSGGGVGGFAVGGGGR
jgi:hypothetical protein